MNLFFFFNDTATTEIYTLSLHDALPIYVESPAGKQNAGGRVRVVVNRGNGQQRSEEHTSELQSHSDLVCRLLLEKKKDEIDYYKGEHTTGIGDFIHSSKIAVLSICVTNQ